MRHIAHIGFHKTGSTWLQDEVFPNVVGAISTSHDKIAYQLIRNLTEGETFLEHTFSAYLGEAQGRVLLSYEGIIGSPWNLGVSASERADRLKMVVPDADIVVVRRDPEELRRSLYVQYIQQGGIGTEDEFEADVLNDDYLNVDIGIDRFRERFDRVHVFEYELVRRSPDQFLAQLGEAVEAEFPAPQKVATVNPSLRGWRLDVLRWWNKAFRKTMWNTDPWVALPGAGLFRYALQISQAYGVAELMRRLRSRSAA